MLSSDLPDGLRYRQKVIINTERRKPASARNLVQKCDLMRECNVIGNCLRDGNKIMPGAVVADFVPIGASVVLLCAEVLTEGRLGV
jgi:hypothetical protein